jgi:hypothetical protein
MDNLFQDVKDSLAAREAERRRLEEAERRALAQVRRAREEVFTPYHEMVMVVLEHLNEALYSPRATETRGSPMDGWWSIGYDRWTWDCPRCFKWITKVSVQLIVDEAGRPARFECVRRARRIRCDPVEAELIHALKQLHPPD